MKIERLPALIQSIDQRSNSSINLHFVDSIQEQDTSSILLIFVRNQFEQYSFLGATRQSYFVIFKSEITTNQQDYSMLIVRHYSLDSLDLINEQTISIPIGFDCLNIFRLVFSLYLMNQMFHRQRILKEPIFIKQIDVNMKNVLK